jgi:hypothetical protein
VQLSRILYKNIYFSCELKIKIYSTEQASCDGTADALHLVLMYGTYESVWVVSNGTADALHLLLMYGAYESAWPA